MSRYSVHYGSAASLPPELHKQRSDRGETKLSLPETKPSSEQLSLCVSPQQRRPLSTAALCQTPSRESIAQASGSRNIKDYYHSTYTAGGYNGDGRRLCLHKGLGNYSSIQLGDDRMPPHQESLQNAIARQSIPKSSASGLGGLDSSIARKFNRESKEQRRREFKEAFESIGEERVGELERMMRDKLQQRTESGPFQLRKNFKYFDRDGDGWITIKEFSQSLELMGFHFNQQQVIALFGRYDTDHDGHIDYFEFCNKVMEKDFTNIKKSAVGSRMRDFLATMSVEDGPASMDGFDEDDEDGSLFDDQQSDRVHQRIVDENINREIRRIFDMIDTDNSGTVDRREFELLTRGLGASMSEAALDAAMERLDADRSGKIDYEEFVQWWHSIGKKNKKASKF